MRDAFLQKQLIKAHLPKIAILLILAALSGCKVKEKKWLFVIHSRSCEIVANELIMRDLDEYAIAFTERPVREKSIIPMIQLINEWPILFGSSNPNATLAFYDAAKRYHEHVVELSDPKLEGSVLRLGITELNGSPLIRNKELNESILFID